MPSLEMLRKLLDEFSEKEAHTREEINVITQRIEELEQNVLESKQKLVEVAIDRDKVLMMRGRYSGEETWAGPTNEVAAAQPQPPVPVPVPAPTPAHTPPTFKPASLMSRSTAAVAAAAPLPQASPAAPAPQSAPTPTQQPPPPAPLPTAPAVPATPVGPISPTSTNQDIRERLRPGRLTASFNNLEAISVNPAAAAAAPGVPAAPMPAAPMPTAAAPVPPAPSPSSASPVTIAALNPRSTGTKIPALQPPPPPPEPATESAASGLFTSDLSAPVSSSNPFSAPIYQAPSMPEPPQQYASPAPDPFAPVLEPNSSFGMTSQAEHASASFNAPPPEPRQQDANSFPFHEANQPSYSGTNESNYMQNAPQAAAPEAAPGDTGNPFFRQVSSIRPASPPPPLPVMPMEQPQNPAAAYDLQQLANYQQAAAELPYDPYAEQYTTQDPRANQDPPYQVPPAPAQDPYMPPTGQEPAQPPQISDFEDEESDDTVKSINDALRGLFR